MFNSICHINVQNMYMGAYPGVGTFCSSGKNGYLGGYPGVGAYPGDYGIYIRVLPRQIIIIKAEWVGMVWAEFVTTSIDSLPISKLN